MIRKIAAVLALAASALPAQAVDGVALELGSGNGVEVLRAGAQWKWQRRWQPSANWRLGGYWELSAGAWDGGRNTVLDLGVAPVFRLEETQPSGSAPYFEAAIGLHLLSEQRITADKEFSTSWQFGDHLGAGLRFGARRQYDLGLRLQHLSNASFKRPNPGINLLLLRFAYALD
jgi:hypothetical protein